MQGKEIKQNLLGSVSINAKACMTSSTSELDFGY